MLELANLTYAVVDRVATITVSREKVLNALDPATLDELVAAVAEVERDPAVAGALLTGAGEKAFVAGADIKILSGLRSADEARRYALAGQAAVRRIEACRKPVIACVNGYALGGGLELALGCHFRYASARARLGLPEVTLGLIPGYGGTQRLARAIGRGPATELVLTGTPIDAQEALRLGLVNRVFDTREAMLAAAAETVRTIGQRGPVAVRLALEAIDRGLEGDLDAGLRLEADLFGVVSLTEDAREGTQAFLGKREASFKGS